MATHFLFSMLNDEVTGIPIELAFNECIFGYNHAKNIW